MLSIISQFGWKCESGDITAAFLQGESIDRDLFIVPPVEANEGTNLWKLLKPVYGLEDASRKFYLKVAEKVQEYGCKRSKFDYALFLYHVNGTLEGILSGHVDDFNFAGTQRFHDNVIKPMKREFKFGKSSYETFKYVGWNISHTRDSITVDQNDYIDEKCEEIPIKPGRMRERDAEVSSEERSLLRSAIGRARWVTDQTRPDASYDELELSMSINKATVKHLLKMNKMTRKLKLDRIFLKFCKIGPLNKLKLTVFTDASFANLPDGISSGQGYIIFLTTGFKPGEQSLCFPLSWQSTKVKRKVTSTLAAETLALRDGLDEAVTLQHQIAEILGVEPTAIKIEAFIDNDDTCKAIYSTKQMMKGRLLIDMGAIKEMIENKEVECVSWIPKYFQLSDSLTKCGASSKNLIETLNSGKFSS